VSLAVIAARALSAIGLAPCLSASAALAVAQAGQPALAAQPTANETIVPGSAAINGAWRAWRSALEARSAFLDPRELAARMEQYRSWLIELDGRLPRAPVPATDATGWQGALVAEAAAQREAALRRVLARIEPQAPALDDPALQAELESSRRSLASWHDRAGLLANDLAAIEVSLAEARTLDEGGASSIRALVEKWVREGLTRQPGVRAAVAPVLDRVDALGRIEQETSTEELLRVAQGGPAVTPELRFAAWRRLSNRGQAVWPATESDLAAEVLIRPLLLRAADAAPSVERTRVLKDEIALEQSRRLTRLLSAAVDDATLTAAENATRDLGLSEESLDNRVRYNLLLNRLKRGVSAPGITDERSRALASEFVAAARNLQGGIAFLSGANTVVAALDAVAGGLVLSPATVEPGRFGPASVGLGAGIEAGATLTFTLPPRSGVPEVSLEFILVGEGAQASYITVHEVTVGQVAAIVAGRNAERQLPSVLPYFRPLDDSRRGPRTWTWTRDAFDVPQVVPSPTWFSAIAGLGGADYPAGQVPSPPSFQSPMQHVPASGAAYIASLAGCRIPTIGEWSALKDEHASEIRQELENFRDAQWSTFQTHVVAQKAANRWADPPNKGIFQGSNTRGALSTAAHPWDDGWLWFAPAIAAENEPTSHVLGNVAEFVTTEPWKIPENCEELKAFVAHQLPELRVIGGSALSPLAVDPLEPQELDVIDALEGFSDVGFRLAFGADAVNRPLEQVGLRVIEILSPTPYLKPR